MANINKGYFHLFKGKKVTFKIVNSFPDIKVQFVEHFGDFKVQIEGNNNFSTETIKVQIVDHFPDVKLQKVQSFGDFKIYLM